MPGYYQPVPPGQKPFAHRSLTMILALIRWLRREIIIARSDQLKLFYLKDSTYGIKRNGFSV